MLIVAAFYRFFRMTNARQVQAGLKELFATSDIFGTILLAEEGINGTVCGSRENIDRLRAYFVFNDLFVDMEYKESFTTENPFIRRHIKIKKEIVTIGVPGLDTVATAGRHVDSHEWNNLLADPAVFVIDVRNRYETALGGFVGAHDPELDSFKEFPAFVANNLDPIIHKRIAMSCTGGIRCEKASAYLAQCGFAEVYQLKGGILKYLEDTPKERSKWRGECFVFDHRVTVDHDLNAGSYTMCFSCRTPLSDEDKKSPDYIEAVACANCKDRVPAAKQSGKKIRHEKFNWPK